MHSYILIFFFGSFGCVDETKPLYDILKRKAGYSLKIKSGIYWDKGGRVSNQDSLSLQQVRISRGRMLMAVVSDGIGGLAEGENASGYIVEKLIEHFYRCLILLIDRRKGKRVLQRSFTRCFYEIKEAADGYAREREIKLGATVSLLLVWKRRYMLVHLGDSRIYLYKGKKQRLLTKDHSDGRNGLTKCLGSFPYQAPFIRYGRVRGKCGFLLCTDGFYRKQNESSFALLKPGEIESEEQIDRRLREMAQFALKKGEKDNMSAVYVRL